MNHQKAIIVGGATLVVVLAAAWALGFFGGADPAVAELQSFREQMRDASDAERRQLREQLRERMGNLSETQRDAFREANRGQWQQFAQQRLDEFFALSRAEQQKRLDEMIDRMVQRQNQPRPNREAGNRGGRGGGRNMTEGQRDQRRKERIARSDPKTRAQIDQFRRMLNDRRQQRGLPPAEGRGGWGGGRV